MSKSRKISLVKVKNFQAHENSEFRLSNGLNLIYATNDSGKSALARALDFVLQNKSEGNDYIFRHAEIKVAEVEIVFENGDVIRRKKGKDKNKDINCVEIKNAEDSDFKSWYAFGSSYPQEVINFIRLPPTSKALGPIHYADQYTKNFLIDRKPSELPSIISSFIGVDDLELGASTLNAKVVRLDKSISGLRKSVEDLTNEINETYGELDNQIDLYDKAKKFYDDSEKIEIELRIASKLYSDILQANKYGKQTKKDILFYTKITNHLDASIPDLEQLKSNYIEITSFNNNYIKLLQDIKDNDSDIEVNEKICSGNFKVLLDESTESLLLIKEMKSHLRLLKEKQDEKTSNLTELAETEREISTYEFDKKDLYKKLKEIEPMCNVCNKIGGVLVEEGYRN